KGLQIMGNWRTRIATRHSKTEGAWMLHARVGYVSKQAYAQCKAQSRRLIAWNLLGAALVAAGCAPAPIKDVIAKPSQGFLESLPPMEDFGQFDSFTDALDKACDLILSKPH